MHLTKHATRDEKGHEEVAISLVVGEETFLLDEDALARLRSTGATVETPKPKKARKGKKP